MDITYDVRFWKTHVYKGKRVTTYHVRWALDGKPFREAYRNKAQAESFRSDLVSAARKGEAFDIATGKPVSWREHADGSTWYEFACRYVDAKWPYASPNHRRSIAEALTDATEALLTTDKGQPPRDAIRAALRSWAFSERVRLRTETPPEQHAQAVAWLARHTVEMRELTKDRRAGALAHAVLDRIGRKLDGTRAAGNTTNRKRMVLHNAFAYARETGILPSNPLDGVTWTRPRTAEQVDPAVVPNPDQARSLLRAVREHNETGARLEAFFGCMYYAALRPEEALDLRRENLADLPSDGWGEFLLAGANPQTGSLWGDEGGTRQRQPLKHRARGETRPVPIHPELVALLRTYLECYGYGRDGLLFTGTRGGYIHPKTYLTVWHAARRRALTGTEAESSLARRPYDLRHAAVSTWLAAGVDPAQVATWAGHSVAVLLRVYTKCIAGREEEAKRRITDATR